MTDHATFNWARRVSRRDIRRLYESDAQGMLDLELLDEVHYGIYARVRDMFEVREAQQFGRVTCRRCREPVPEPFRMGTQNKGDVLRCNACGWQTTCGDYYAGYSGKSLLPGSATGLFEAYLERFPQAKTPHDKLLLIDWLIHQFHVMQGVPRMPVGRNVIAGTEAQVRELIKSLAYGASSTQGLASPEAWRATYEDPVRQFKQAHTHAEVQRIAAELGIEGRTTLTENELIPEILRRMDT